MLNLFDRNVVVSITIAYFIMSNQSLRDLVDVDKGLSFTDHDAVDDTQGVLVVVPYYSLEVGEFDSLEMAKVTAKNKKYSEFQIDFVNLFVTSLDMLSL